MIRRIAPYLLLALPVLVRCQASVVDFRYAPSRYFAATCFPNDWLKSVVTESHGLGYDFGPGPYATPLTEVLVRALGDSLLLSKQWCAEPAVPVFSANFIAPGITVTQEAFSVPLGKSGLGSRKNPAVQRSLGWNGTVSWAKPDEGVDPAFRNVAWGVNRPILYRVPVRRGSEKLVVLGICEPYKRGPGLRILELKVEGAQSVVFDPLAGGKRNEPQVLFFHGGDADQDGHLTIEAHAAVSSPDPNPVLNAFWIFSPDTRVAPRDLISGEASKKAEMYFRCGLEEEAWQNDLRADILISMFMGKSVTPEITVSSLRSLDFNSTDKIIECSGRPFVVTSPRPERAYRGENMWHLILPKGTSRVETYALHGPWTRNLLSKLPTGTKAKETVARFWRKEVRLPHSHISVPDSGIQYLLDASIRNLYQLGEIIDGGLEFHPGPSVYRGLWVHDAAWHISALHYVGDAMSAKLAIERLLRFQLPSGQIRVMAPYIMNRESPIVAYTMVRFARLSNDREWLLGHWENLVQALSWTAQRRKETLGDPASPGYGLFPPGFADGGVGGIGFEYASVYWALVGFRAGIEASLWLNKAEAARQWQDQYDELMASFRRAANRDMRKNAAGHWYLPIRVADTSGGVPPQLASWALLDAQGLAHLFDVRDSLVTGTLAMLQDSTREGLPTNTGWLKDGLWPFFGSLQGIAHTYQRDYGSAQRMLYAVADHASPLGTWVEEQLPKSVGPRTSGDGSNATASALFIKQVRRLLIMERGDTLELLAGIPDTWIAPGKSIILKDCPAVGGNVSLSLSVAPDGHRASIVMGPVGKVGVPGCIALDLGAVRRAGYSREDGAALPELLRIERGEPFRITLKR